MTPPPSSKSSPPPEPPSCSPLAVHCKCDAIVALDAHPPHPKNDNVHTQEQLALFVKILKRQGIRRAAVVSKESGHFVTGHGLREALHSMGVTGIPVDYQSFASQKEELAHLMADNQLGKLAVRNDELTEANLQELNGDDFDLALAGFTDEQLEDFDLGGSGFNEPAEEEAGDKDAPARIDEAAELNKKWNVQPGDIWSIGSHRLMCGSSTDAQTVVKLLSGNKPRLMVTDPPYGINYDANWRNEAERATGKKLGARAIGKVTNDDRAAWAACYVLSPSDICYIWHAGLYASTVERGLVAAGFEVRSQIIWAKKRFVISRGNYHGGHEPCWYAVRKGETANFLGGRKQSTLWADIIDRFEPKDLDPLCAVQLDAERVYAFPASATTLWSLPNDKACGGGALHAKAA